MNSKRILVLGSIFLALLALIPQKLFAEAGWDNGFWIKSADGDFKMKVGGRIQFMEEIRKRSGVEPGPPGGAKAAGQAPNDFSDTFKIRRARIETVGTLFGKLDWFTMITTSTVELGTPSTVWYAGFTYNFVPQFLLSGGMVQLPMDRMGEGSSAWYLGIEPPLTATQEDGVVNKSTGKAAPLANVTTIARDSFGLPFDLGVRADGDIGSHFSYAVGVGNGSGYKNINANNELSYGARAVVHILDPVPYKETDFEFSEKPKLSVGIGTGFEDQDANDANFVAITRRWSWSSSGDVAFRYKGFSLNSEIYYRILRLSASTVEDTNNDRKLKDVGYYGNVGYYVIPKKLELMLMASQIFREGPDNNANEFGGGVNWYIKENKAKLQLDFTNVLDYDDIPGLNNATYNKIRLMFSMFI